MNQQHINTNPNKLMDIIEIKIVQPSRQICSLQFHFAGKQPNEGSTTYDPKMYVHSKWTPPHWTIPPVALKERLSRFSKELGTLFKTGKGKTNLLPHRQRALSTLQQQDTFLIVLCDKNLGLAIIEHHDYLKIAMRDHLNDTTTYKLLNPSEIERFATIIKKALLPGLKHIIKNSQRWNEHSSGKNSTKTKPHMQGFIRP